LAERGFKNPRLNIEMMLASVLKSNRIQLYLDFEMPLNQTEINEFKTLLKRRLSHEPLQYILGKTNFYGYEILLNNSVLIPRQETELLVETFLKDLQSINNNMNRILEIGTGSGCIAIAIAKELKAKNYSFNIKSIDISNEAIELAEHNKLKQKSENLDFKVEDIFNLKDFNNFDFVISNPPYISLTEYKKLDREILEYEPDFALTDKSDGYTFFRQIFKMLNNTSKKCKVYCEIGSEQKNYLESLLISLKILSYNFLKDYSGLDRILILEN
jgi:release factor glutamine methyltransferase